MLKCFQLGNRSILTMRISQNFHFKDTQEQFAIVENIFDSHTIRKLMRTILQYPELTSKPPMKRLYKFSPFAKFTSRK